LHALQDLAELWALGIPRRCLGVRAVLCRSMPDCQFTEVARPARASVDSPNVASHGLATAVERGKHSAATVMKCHSSALESFASTLKSSRVVVSPFTSPPAAICFSNRRMILPERVLGNASANRISSGLATG